MAAAYEAEHNAATAVRAAEGAWRATLLGETAGPALVERSDVENSGLGSEYD